MTKKTMTNKKLTKKQIEQRDLKLKICDIFWSMVDKLETKYKCDFIINIEELKLK